MEKKKTKSDSLKRVRKYLKSQIEAQKYSGLAALIPEACVLIFLICNIRHPVIDTSHLLDYWETWVFIIFLSVAIWLYALRSKRRLNSLYTRVNTGTVYVINTEIIEFKFWDSNSKKIWESVSDCSYWYMLITSDWIRTYKTRKFLAKELKLPKYNWSEPEFLTIDWKNYYIWDRIVVYVDPNYKNNYIFDLWL